MNIPSRVDNALCGAVRLPAVSPSFEPTRFDGLPTVSQPAVELNVKKEKLQVPGEGLSLTWPPKARHVTQYLAIPSNPLTMSRESSM